MKKSANKFGVIMVLILVITLFLLVVFGFRNGHSRYNSGRVHKIHFPIPDPMIPPPLPSNKWKYVTYNDSSLSGNTCDHLGLCPEFKIQYNNSFVKYNTPGINSKGQPISLPDVAGVIEDSFFGNIYNQAYDVFNNMTYSLFNVTLGVYAAKLTNLPLGEKCCVGRFAVPVAGEFKYSII